MPQRWLDTGESSGDNLCLMKSKYLSSSEDQVTRSISSLIIKKVFFREGREQKQKFRFWQLGRGKKLETSNVAQRIRRVESLSQPATPTRALAFARVKKPNRIARVQQLLISRQNFFLQESIKLPQLTSIINTFSPPVYSLLFPIPLSPRHKCIHKRTRRARITVIKFLGWAGESKIIKLYRYLAMHEQRVLERQQ